MKHTHNFILALTFLSLALVNCGNTGQSTKPSARLFQEKAVFPNTSCTLNTADSMMNDSLFVKSFSDALTDDKCFGLFFQGYSGGKSVSYYGVKYADTVPITALSNLRITLNPGVCQTRGLRINYALTIGTTEPVLVYEPIVLQLDSTDSANGNYYLYFHLADSGTYYSYDPANQKFDTLLTSTAQQEFSTFSTSVQVINATSLAYSGIISGADPTSVIFPWAEFDSLVQDNNASLASYYKTHSLFARLLAGDFQKNNSHYPFLKFLPLADGQSPEITAVVFSYAATDGSSKTSNYVTTITMTPVLDGVVAQLVSGIFSGTCANMGAMCPFNCSPVIFYQAHSNPAQ